jgi:hypothetical protein
VSVRSREARLLAAELSRRAGVVVELVYEKPGEWILTWSCGPTVDGMRALVDRALPGFPAMRGQQLRPWRGWSMRAWAARAVASHREGRLALAVAEGAKWRRERGIGGRWSAGAGDASPEYFALIEHVEAEIDGTPAPGRASDQGDEAVIERLLTAGEESERGMALLVLRESRFVFAGELPAGVVSLAERRSRGRAGTGE